MNRAGRFLDGHLPGLDFLFGGASEYQAGGEQPFGAQRCVEVAAFLAAPDELQHPAEHRSVPTSVLGRVGRGQVPEERVAGGGLPASVEQPHQRDGGRQLVEPGGVEGRGDLGGGVLDDGVEERLAGGEMGVDGLAADPGGPRDVLDAGPRVRVKGPGRGLQDRGDAVPGVGPLPPAPDLRLR